MSESRYIHDTAIHRTKDAELIVPILNEMFKPRSVLDVGCGLGAFLKIFLDSGVDHVLGIEGAWIDESKLLVDRRRIVNIDIENGFILNEKFDVALCLEVAEHINESNAINLVKSLTAHSDIIIFSAAVPGQGGQNHVNEQWINYWQELFASDGYRMFDVIRPRIWGNNDIFWWYRQNILVCMHSSLENDFIGGPVHNLIHPELYSSKIAELSAYKQWIDNIFSGKIDVVVAQAILKNSMECNSPTSTEHKHL